MPGIRDRVAQNIQSGFDGAAIAQELGKARSELEQANELVTKLTQEIEQMRAESGGEDTEALQKKLATLTAQLETQSGVREIPLKLIDPNPDQPRKTFPPDRVTAMASSLLDEGQKTPIILIALTNGRFFLFDGERRWRGAKQIKWQTLRAVIMPEGTSIDKHELRRAALLTTAHRDDLHPLDLAHCLIDEAVYRYPEFQAAADDAESPRVIIPRILNNVIARIDRAGLMAEMVQLAGGPQVEIREWLEACRTLKDPQELAILELLLGLQFNPASVNKNIFSMLKLPADLQDKIREHGIEASKARVVATLTAERLGMDETEAIETRQDVADQVAAEQLSLSKTKELVQGIISQYSSKNAPSPAPVKQVKKMTLAIQDLDIGGMSRIGKDAESLIELRDALKQKVQEIDKLLKA